MKPVLFAAVLFFATLADASGLFTHGPGITDNIPSSDSILYLTLDACDSRPNGYDAKLINFLRKERIPATLFLNLHWIKANSKITLDLAGDTLFKIENHGARHRPASITGKLAYDIKGAKSKKELINDILPNQEKILELTKRKSTWFRSGTAHYEAEAVNEILALGIKIAGFAINADYGAMATASTIEKSIAKAHPGDIILAHMNRPESQTFAGLSKALLKMKAQGYKFEKLPD
ncbi:MAG: polysaccharide deacetylase family protein [Fibromonadales bacterium]|nr:polysaccharide deacetylase family protein [Fibromonadales bacterium]